MLRSESRERRPKWYLLYYVLAAIAVLTICGSLYLNHAVRLIHQGSVAVNQEWAQQHSNLLELANLAQAVNAPGNDIFDSRDADQEQARHEQALAMFEAKLVQIRQELFSKPRTTEVRSLIASLYEINAAMDTMTATADLIFVYFRANEPAQATRYNATMDHTFGQVLHEIGKAEQVIRQIQSDQFRAQLGSAARLGRFEYLIGGVIFVIVILVAIYGHRMHKTMRAAEAERRRLMAALRDSEATAQGRLHDAIESLNGGFVLYDADDRLVMCNRTYRGMYPETADLNVAGTRFEELIRADVARGQVPEAMGRAEAWLAERMRAHLAGESTSEQQLADGRWILVSERRTSEGGVVGIRTDITARKQAELQLQKTLDELKSATDRLARQERLSMLGQVAGTVSHELRNPLSAIRNSMALLRQLTTGKVAGVERALDRIDRNIERCARIINDILDFTRVRELKREPTPLDTWLGDTLGEIAVPAAVTIRREFQFGGDIALDRDRFRQIVVNLVENAAQALADPGWMPADDRRRAIVLRTEDAGPYVRLTVGDNGPGIPEDRLPKIFEPLFTTKSFGVGLGLPTVRQIVEQHGGTIDVESTVDQGTAFTIWLPRQSPPNAAEAPAGQAQVA
ncbi:MAG: sensor histidine kinase [Dongiaceae bacterium]